LTTIGSQRGGTALDRHSETYDDVPYGGFYTQEQIREVIQYAAERYITVIPEIDIPGHTLAVLAAYPHLGCTGGPYEVARGWGIFEDVLCAGNDSVFTFLEDVFTEVAELFPSQYIHIGGDECLKNRWAACPKCRQRIRDLGIWPLYAHTPEEQLQSYLIKRVEEMINRKGKKIIGWDEILEGGIAPNATIMSWRGTQGGINAAREGHDVIITPEAYVYLDYYQSPNIDKEPFTFGWLTDLAKTYSFDPVPAGLPEDKRHHILGGQVNIWTEYMATPEHVEYMLLPRMAAFAETLWHGNAGNDYNGFVKRMYKQSLLLDQLGYMNCKEAYDIQAVCRQDTLRHTIQLTLSTFDNAPIYYTIDGSEPNEKSLKYTEPLVLDQSCVIHAVTYRDGHPGATLTREFSIHKATARPVTLGYAPDPRYTFQGASTLVDGMTGYNESYRTGTWIGFLAGSLDATIRLDDQTSFSKVSFNTFVNTRGALFPPASLTIQVSDDGKQYRTVYNERFPEVAAHIKPEVFPISATFEEQTANYVKIIAGNTWRLPSWHERQGYTHLMVDELVVE
ncbi:MAG: family 20 glycosylhydrolase, partial [Tannerellaceae bacterium]|nr:family 20 glycosylhydrolase [Tannerellaceae bacterium]